MLAKMFCCTVLSVTPLCFGLSCDPLLGVLQQEYKQYTINYVQMREKPLQGYQLSVVNALL